ncbi:hypothetical protein F5887DRAFT_928706 [Amanita rubescens]|nr:hypothetical protein F5887DRAFT_928706 [Amanita rubescens]
MSSKLGKIKAKLATMQKEKEERERQEQKEKEEWERLEQEQVAELEWELEAEVAHEAEWKKKEEAEKREAVEQRKHEEARKKELEAERKARASVKPGPKDKGKSKARETSVMDLVLNVEQLGDGKASGKQLESEQIRKKAGESSKRKARELSAESESEHIILS